MVELEEFDKNIPLETVMKDFSEAGCNEDFLKELKRGFKSSTVYSEDKQE
jgi:hypothetical protein